MRASLAVRIVVPCKSKMWGDSDDNKYSEDFFDKAEC